MWTRKTATSFAWLSSVTGGTPWSPPRRRIPEKGRLVRETSLAQLPACPDDPGAIPGGNPAGAVYGEQHSGVTPRPGPVCGEPPPFGGDSGPPGNHFPAPGSPPIGLRCQRHGLRPLLPAVQVLAFQTDFGQLSPGWLAEAQGSRTSSGSKTGIYF